MEGSVKLPPNFDIRSPNAASEWKVWIQAFEDYLVSIGKDDSQDKVKLSLLRNMMGIESARLLHTLPITETESQVYANVIRAINNYVSPRANQVFERYKFNERKQKEGESFHNFLTDLKQLLANCSYKNVEGQESLEDQILRDKIVQGIYDKSLQESLLRIDNLTLEKATNFCRTSEISKKQAKEMNPNIEIDIVKKRNSLKQKEKEVYQGNKEVYNGKQKNKGRQHAYQENKTKYIEKFNCRRCKRNHGPRECPAFGQRCHKCGLKNHFAVSCNVKKRVQNVDCNSDSDSNSKLYCCSITRNQVKGNKKTHWTENILIENRYVNCRLDTGADVSIMPLNIYKSLGSNIELRKCNQSLEAFQGSTIKPVGMVNLHCKYKAIECYEDFMVVDCKSMLLGLPGCIALNLVKRINTVNLNCNDEKFKFIQENMEIFEGHGNFPKPVDIPTLPHEQICHAAPKIPNKLYNPLKCELNRLVKRKAITKVEEISSEACINRLVLVEKPNGNIRLCLDPSELNKKIIRKPQVLLTVDEIACKVKGKKYFSVFDLSEGFHHVTLTESASWKCCFATPFGVYRYLVLPYGLSNSPDVFQDQIQNYFGDIPNVITWFDDLLVMGETEEAHDKTVREVIKRAKQIKAKFNKDKLQYKLKEIKYIGQIFSEKGMEMDKDRVKSLLSLEAPRNIAELRRIIGSFNYVRRYVPEMAELMAPLCQLLKKDVLFQWLPIHDKNFSELKKKVSEAPALSAFDSKKEIIMQCDASQNGIGSCLFQKDDNNCLRLVACVSRTMNNCELNYSQTEKELLAIYFGTQKFHKYIYGAKNIQVQTDHKPLISIIKKPITKVGSPRLRRLCLKLLNYRLNLNYIPGKDIHFADMLSRCSIKTTEKDYEMLDMVHSVSLHLPMSSERKSEFRSETSKDKVLSEIIKYYYQGWPEENKLLKECKPYFKFKEDIYVESGLVFYTNKIIVPKSLQLYVLNLVHSGHPGISKSIKKARQLFYWPKLSQDIQIFISKCRTCEKFKSANTHEPLLTHKIPKLRFSKVGSDIMEYGGKSYLVVVDYLSHWLEIIPIINKSSKSVINAFQEVFTRFGYPTEIIADNNPFKSYECIQYYKSKDICITTSSPHYPRSNGMSEKAVNIAKNLLKKAREDNVDYRDFLLSYNCTPLSSLEVSPSQILQSRQLRTCVPITESMLEPKIEKNIHKLLTVKQSITKKIHDRFIRKGETNFKEGENVTYRTGHDSYWKKGVVIKKSKEPRSYWISRGENCKPFRRTSHHIKRSNTKTHSFKRDFFDYSLNDKVSNNVPNIVSENSNQSNIPHKACHTRSGRIIKPRDRLNL